MSGMEVRAGYMRRLTGTLTVDFLFDRESVIDRDRWRTVPPGDPLWPGLVEGEEASIRAEVSRIMAQLDAEAERFPGGWRGHGGRPRRIWLHVEDIFGHWVRYGLDIEGQSDAG